MSLREQVLDYFRANPGDTLFPEDAALKFGTKSRGYLNDVLARLVAERLLDRHDFGRRGFLYSPHTVDDIDRMNWIEKYLGVDRARLDDFVKTQHTSLKHNEVQHGCDEAEARSRAARLCRINC